MNSRERVRLALTCQAPDRIPMTLAFWEESLPAIAPKIPAEHFGLDVRFVEFAPPAGQDDFLCYLAGLPRDVHVGDAAQLRTYHEWNYHPERGPDGPLSAVQTVEELLYFRLPELSDARRHAGLARQVEKWHSQGWAVAGSPPHLGGELFETAYRLRGFENFLADLRLRPELAEYLLDQLTALTVHNAAILARAGVDILLLDDDVAMPTGLIVSPTAWRRFFKPRLADVIRLARQVGSGVALPPQVGSGVALPPQVGSGVALLTPPARELNSHTLPERSATPFRTDQVGSGVALPPQVGSGVALLTPPVRELNSHTLPERSATPFRTDSGQDLLIFYHSDGDFTAIVPDLVEIGVNVINPLQPDCMDALALKRRFGDRLALWGTVGTAALWQHGTPADIRAEVRQRIETLGPAGLLLSPAYDLDFAPFENVAAFVEAVKEWGRNK